MKGNIGFLGFLMCLTAPLINNLLCTNGRAGLSKFWITECSNVLDLVFSAVNRDVVGIVMSAQPGAGRFVLVTFEKNTAFLTQEKTRVNNGTNTVQTLSFNEPTLNPVTRRLLEDLNNCCCYHVIAKDNNAQYHYLGITYFYQTGVWQSEDLRTGTGSGNTGADPTADANQYVETLTANTTFYAPHWGLAENQIPV